MAPYENSYTIAIHIHAMTWITIGTMDGALVSQATSRGRDGSEPPRDGSPATSTRHLVQAEAAELRARPPYGSLEGAGQAVLCVRPGAVARPAAAEGSGRASSGYDPAIGGAAKLGSTDLGRGGRDRRKRLATGQPMLATSGGRSASGEGRCVAAADDLRPGSTRVWVVARRGGGLGSLGPAGSAKPIVMMHCNSQ